MGRVSHVVLALSFLLVFPVIHASAQSPGMKPPHEMGGRPWRGEGRCPGVLELSPLQIRQRLSISLVTVIFRKQGVCAWNFSQAARTKRISDGPYGEGEAIHAKTSEIVELQSRLEETATDYLLKVRNLLTQEQLKNWCPEQDLFMSQRMMERPHFMPHRPAPASKKNEEGIAAESILSKPATRIRRSFSPVYLAILSGIILVILIINGLLEINRTQKGFLLLLEREATLILEGLQKNMEETSEALSFWTVHQRNVCLIPRSLHSSTAWRNLLLNILWTRLTAWTRGIGEHPWSLWSSSLSPRNFSCLPSNSMMQKETCLRAGLPALPMNRRSLLRELIVKKRSVVIDLFGKSLVVKDFGSPLPFREEGLQGSWLSISMVNR